MQQTSDRVSFLLTVLETVLPSGLPGSVVAAAVSDLDRATAGSDADLVARAAFRMHRVDP